MRNLVSGKLSSLKIAMSTMARNMIA